MWRFVAYFSSYLLVIISCETELKGEMEFKRAIRMVTPLIHIFDSNPDYPNYSEFSLKKHQSKRSVRSVIINKDWKDDDFIYPPRRRQYSNSYSPATTAAPSCCCPTPAPSCSSSASSYGYSYDYYYLLPTLALVILAGLLIYLLIQNTSTSGKRRRSLGMADFDDFGAVDDLNKGIFQFDFPLRYAQ